MTAAGVPRKLRNWNSRTGQYTWFPAGRDYYDNNRQRFIINVPCIGYIHPDDMDGEPGGASVAGGLDIDEDNVDITPLIRMSVWGQGNYNRTIPLIPDGDPAEFRRPSRAGRDSNLGLVRDRDYAQKDIEEALRRSIPDILRSYPQILTRDGLKRVIAIESKVIWVWDEDAEITFDEQIFRHVYSQEVPLIETLLDRPLLGLPYIDELMYGRQGLSKLASLDLTDRGGCVVAQIYELAETEKKLSSPGAQNKGKDTRERVKAKRFKSLKEVEDAFDRIFARLFPGEAVDEEAFEAGEVEAQRPYPYQFAGWKEAGPTTRMVAEFCDYYKIGLRVLYQNSVIFKNDVNAKNDSVLVYHIFGNHAYFYDDWHVKRGAVQLREGPSKIQMKLEDAVRLRTRFDEDNAVPYTDMEEYNFEAFMDQVKEQISKTYWCFQRDVKDIKQQLEDAGVALWTGLGARPEQIRSLNLQPKTNKEKKGKRNMSQKKVQIRVRVVPDDAEILQGACLAFKEIAGLSLIYYGESRSACTHRMLNTLFVSRRLAVPDCVKRDVVHRQKGCCAICGDKIEKGEFDHISPLCQGGTNDADNLRWLCSQCHAEETDRLLLSGTALGDRTLFHTIESHMSPGLYRLLHQAPKPKEVSWGCFDDEQQIKRKLAPTRGDAKREVVMKKMKDWHAKYIKTRRVGKAKNIKDVMSQHRVPRSVFVDPLPEIPNSSSRLKCLDAVGCRRNALLKCKRGLPVFSPLDDWEPYSREDLPTADFVFVDIGKQPHPGLFPYTGSRWYAAEVCEYMLQKDLITDADCKAILRATRRVPGELLQKQMEVLEDVYQNVQFFSQSQRAAYVKGCLLSAIGLWNATSQFAFKQKQSHHQIDAGPAVKLRRRMDDGSFIFTSYTELVGLYSMAPWGRIALDAEQLRIAEAMDVLSQHEEHVKVIGAHVDGVFVLDHSVEDIDAQLTGHHLWPDGTPKFHLKKEKAFKVPTWKAENVVRSQEVKFERHKWKTLKELEVPNIDALVEAFLEKGGLMVSGPAGTGKTLGLLGVHSLMHALSKKVPGKHLACALRHCAAMLMCGKTISHYLHKYRSKGGAPRPGTIVVIDEWSEVQLHTWVELAQWKLVGVRFVLVGDADGQRRPIFDKWQDAMNSKDIRYSSLIHELCGGLRLQLTEYRRGTDLDLFKTYTGLYHLADDDSQVPMVVAAMREKYPLEHWHTLCGCFFALSHKKRMMINHVVNWKLADLQEEVEFIPSSGEVSGWTTQPQDMIVWKGLELLCYSRRYCKNSPVTGAVYVVNKWDGRFLTVELHNDYLGKRLIPPHEAAAAEEGGEEDEEEQSDEEALEELPDREPTRPDRECVMSTVEVRQADGTKLKKPVFKLSYKRASQLLRLQHSIVYAAMQGRTFKTSVALLDLDSNKITMRDLITAMSRPTRGSDLRFATPEQQARLLSYAAKNTFDLRKRVADKLNEPASERPVPTRFGRA